MSEAEQSRAGAASALHGTARHGCTPGQLGRRLLQLSRQWRQTDPPFPCQLPTPAVVPRPPAPHPLSPAVYPVAAHWVWSPDGWLSPTRTDCATGLRALTFPRSVGLIDFSGSGALRCAVLGCAGLGRHVCIWLGWAELGWAGLGWVCSWLGAPAPLPPLQRNLKPASVCPPACLHLPVPACRPGPSAGRHGGTVRRMGCRPPPRALHRR